LLRRYQSGKVLIVERRGNRGEITTRIAMPTDEPAIIRLLRDAPRMMLRTRWWEEYLGDDTFLLTLADGLPVGVLFAQLDTGPVAWTQLGALDIGVRVDDWLAVSLSAVVPALRKQGARLLLWLDAEGWAGDELRKQGFSYESSIMMLGREQSELRPVIAPGVQLRKGRARDLSPLAALDRSAFTPPWWQSEETLLRLQQHSTCFLVAERDGMSVGYVEGNVAGGRAHIGRLAVAPQHQGQGIGGLLLQGALERLWAEGAGLVTLNTQKDNYRSQRLYRRFGFRRLGAEIEVLGRYL
jgi:ribosomal protein S18 acetylase RimI-like enzyme